MELDPTLFNQEGYAGPFPLLDARQIAGLLEERYTPEKRLTWYKSRHERSPAIVRAACSPAVIDRLKAILGQDILLWGSQFITQNPGQAHGWHLDVEYGKWNGVTLWVGLKNLSRETKISVVTRSHSLPVTPNEMHRLRGVDIHDDDRILAEARKLDPECRLKTFTVQPGEFVVWSGRVWHATSNESRKTRFSMIFQYCTPDNVARIPLNYEYPDTRWSDVEPPCVLVAGADRYRRNKVLRGEDIESGMSLGRRLQAKADKARYVAGALRGKLFPSG